MRLATLAGGLAVIALGILLLLDADDVLDLSFAALGPIGERDFTPVSAQQLPDEYKLAIGELDVDLTQLALPEGTTRVTVEVGIGEAHVLVPHGVGLHVTGHAGAGDVRLPGGQSDGTDVDREETIVVPGRPVLDLEVRVGLGEVHVERAS